MNEYEVNITRVSNKTDVTSLCRLCLRNSMEKRPLNSPLLEIFEVDVTSLFDLMQKLSSTKLSNHPKYPSCVCFECESLLTIAYQVNRLIEFSQTRLSVMFKEKLQTYHKGMGDSDTVEIISDKGKYNLRDLLIVEDEGKQDTNYEGFLRNLGTAITAYFTSKDCEKRKVKEANVHKIDIVPLSKLEDSTNDNVRIEETKTKLINVKPTVPTVKRKNKYGKIFTNKRILCRFNRRYRNRQPFESNSLLCHICGMIYVNKTSIYHHLLKHKNVRLYLCTTCGKNFTHVSSLDYHMRMHRGEKRHKCTYCDRAFPIRSSLERHLRTHTGLRPYKCSFCDKMFRSAGETKVHEMIHTGFRPYHCKLCGKGFTKTYNLNVHMLCHSGPILCDFCKRGFTDAVYLKLHMKLSHGLQNYDVNDASVLAVDEESTELDDLHDENLLTTPE